MANFSSKVKESPTKPAARKPAARKPVATALAGTSGRSTPLSKLNPDNFSKQQITPRKRTTRRVMRKATPGIVVASFLDSYKLTDIERINLIRKGLAVNHIDKISKSMGASKEELYRIMGIAPSSISRWSKESKPLNKEASSRVLGIQRLIGQVQYMVNNYGDPKDFNAAQWFNDWANEPNPSLNGVAPMEYLDTDAGVEMIANLLNSMLYGNYQ